MQCVLFVHLVLFIDIPTFGSRCADTIIRNEGTVGAGKNNIER